VGKLPEGGHVEFDDFQVVLVVQGVTVTKQTLVLEEIHVYHAADDLVGEVHAVLLGEQALEPVVGVVAIGGFVHVYGQALLLALHVEEQRALVLVNLLVFVLVLEDGLDAGVGIDREAELDVLDHLGVGALVDLLLGALGLLLGEAVVGVVLGAVRKARDFVGLLQLDHEVFNAFGRLVLELASNVPLLVFVVLQPELDLLHRGPVE